jgi:hypothetical protein
MLIIYFRYSQLATPMLSCRHQVQNYSKSSHYRHIVISIPQTYFYSHDHRVIFSECRKLKCFGLLCSPEA